MKIQLLYFEGCPNIDAARAAICTALEAERLDLVPEEIDIEASTAPTWARGWGSPTILVDGKDVTGQAPPTSSESSACRLYAGGAPSVDVIRARLRGNSSEPQRRVALPMIGAVTAAIAASACCLVPAVMAIVGISGAGFAARFTPYRPYFLIATGIALAAGFWFAYRPLTDACGCAVPRRRGTARLALWITTLLTIALAAYPLFGSGNVTAGSTETEAKATLHLKVTGMDCKECTAGIAKHLRQVPGVVSATVDFESGDALVRYDGRPAMATAAIKAVEDAGFSATLTP